MRQDVPGGEGRQRVGIQVSQSCPVSRQWGGILLLEPISTGCLTRNGSEILSFCVASGSQVWWILYCFQIHFVFCSLCQKATKLHILPFRDSEIFQFPYQIPCQTRFCSDSPSVRFPGNGVQQRSPRAEADVNLIWWNHQILSFFPFLHGWSIGCSSVSWNPTPLKILTHCEEAAEEPGCSSSCKATEAAPSVSPVEMRAINKLGKIIFILIIWSWSFSAPTCYLRDFHRPSWSCHI